MDIIQGTHEFCQGTPLISRIKLQCFQQKFSNAYPNIILVLKYFFSIQYHSFQNDHLAIDAFRTS